jgi:hypothetical protein
MLELILMMFVIVAEVAVVVFPVVLATNVIQTVAMKYAIVLTLVHRKILDENCSYVNRMKVLYVQILLKFKQYRWFLSTRLVTRMRIKIKIYQKFRLTTKYVARL